MPSMIKCFLAYKQCLKWTHQLLEGSLFVEAVADTAPPFQPMAVLVACLDSTGYALHAEGTEKYSPELWSLLYNKLNFALQA
jgi:hypothetical protein